MAVKAAHTGNEHDLARRVAILLVHTRLDADGLPAAAVRRLHLLHLHES